MQEEDDCYASKALQPGSAPNTEPDLILSSEDLFANREVIRIRHGGETYCLRITRNGKLILNK